MGKSLVGKQWEISHYTSKQWKIPFSPHFFPQFFLVGKQIFSQNLQFFPLNLLWEIDGFLAVMMLCFLDLP